MSLNNPSSQESIPLILTQSIQKAHLEYIWSISFHPFLSLFSTCGNDRTIAIWSLNTSTHQFEKLCLLNNTHTRTIRHISWSPNGRYLAAASFDSQISIWSFNWKSEFKCLTILEGHESEVKSVNWSISGNYLATCSRDKTLWIWDIEEANDTLDFSCNTVIQGHTQDVKTVKFSPREDVLLSGSYDESIKVWKYEDISDDWECVNTLTQHKGTVWCIDFNNSGNRFISSSEDTSVILWEILDLDWHGGYKKINTVQIIKGVFDSVVYSCVFSKDEKNRYIFSAGGDKVINVMAIDEGDEQMKYKEKGNVWCAHEDDINGLSYSVKDNCLLSCSDDSNVNIWRIK